MRESHHHRGINEEDDAWRAPRDEGDAMACNEGRGMIGDAMNVGQSHRHRGLIDDVDAMSSTEG